MAFDRRPDQRGRGVPSGASFGPERMGPVREREGCPTSGCRVARDRCIHAVEHSGPLSIWHDGDKAHRRHSVSERWQIDELGMAEVSVLGRLEQIAERRVSLRSRVGPPHPDTARRSRPGLLPSRRSCRVRSR